MMRVLLHGGGLVPDEYAPLVGWLLLGAMLGGLALGTGKMVLDERRHHTTTSADGESNDRQ